VRFEIPSFEITHECSIASYLEFGDSQIARLLKERITMRITFTVNHNEHVNSRSFEEVISAFESAVGSVGDTGFPALLASTKSAEEFEASVQSRAGSSGFMRFLTVDHGPWMARIGLKARARMYTIGNPLIARTMLEHDIAAGLKCSCSADDL
jgi:hypothetical protein